jgi:hypothetical protein
MGGAKGSPRGSWEGSCRFRVSWEERGGIPEAQRKAHFHPTEVFLGFES